MENEGRWDGHSHGHGPEKPGSASRDLDNGQKASNGWLVDSLGSKEREETLRNVGSRVIGATLHASRCKCNRLRRIVRKCSVHKVMLLQDQSRALQGREKRREMRRWSGRTVRWKRKGNNTQSGVWKQAKKVWDQ